MNDNAPDNPTGRLVARLPALLGPGLRGPAGRRFRWPVRGRRSRPERWLAALAAAIVLAASGPGAPARGADGDRVVSCRVTYRTPDGVYVDVGKEQGLAAGTPVTLRPANGVELRLEIAHAARATALLRPAAGTSVEDLKPGDRVQLVFPPSASPPEGNSDATEPEGVKKGGSTLKGDGDDDEPFVPLLTPRKQQTIASASEANIFHGRLYARQMFQTDSENLLDSSTTRVGSSGSVDRIEGTPWNFEWSVDLSYRDGHAMRFARDYQDPRLRVFLASFHRKFDDGSFVRFGRFLPRELPSIGYVDGAQGEKVVNRHVRVGGLLGLKPDRDNLDISTREPMGAVYTTVEAGKRGEALNYSGTTGLLGTLFDGEPDRLALLLDQSAGFGKWVDLYSTMEVDFDAGAAEVRSGPQLTHFDLYAVTNLTEWLSLRAGADHYERPDIQSERELLFFPDERFFDRGYWRYWLGSTVQLPWQLSVSPEISWTDSTDADDPVRWQLAVTRRGLFSLEYATTTLFLYNLAGQDIDGYGGRLTSYLPLYRNKIAVLPNAGFRFVNHEPGSNEFTITDLSCRVEWRPDYTWTLYGGFGYYFGKDLNTIQVDFGATFRW